MGLKGTFQKIFVILTIIGALIGISIAFIYYQMNNYPVVKVNGLNISRADYKDQFKKVKDQYAIYFGVDFTTTDGKKLLSTVKNEAIKSLAQWKIIEAEAKKRGISVSNREVEDKFKEIEKQFSTKLQFEMALAQYGLTPSSFKKEIKKSLLSSKLMAEIGKDEKVNENEMKKYYEENKYLFENPKQYKVSIILIKDEKKAKEVAKEIKDKKISFAEAAKKYSEDSSTKDKGGDLGYISSGYLPVEVEKVTFTLPLNQVSNPIKTDQGYYITTVSEIKEAYTLPYIQAKPEIEKTLLNEKRSKVFNKWLEEQYKKAKIEKDFSDKDIWMRLWRKLIQFQQIFYRSEAKTPLPSTEEL
ncbi:MAG: SurA N-terminal domain-containing protein [Dictyoglomaceae bacterium]